MDSSPPGFSVHGISRQKYWSGLPFPPPGDLPDPGIEPVSLMAPALAGRFFTTSTIYFFSLRWELLLFHSCYCIRRAELRFLLGRKKRKRDMRHLRLPFFQGAFLNGQPYNFCLYTREVYGIYIYTHKYMYIFKILCVCLCISLTVLLLLLH